MINIEEIREYEKKANENLVKNFESSYGDFLEGLLAAIKEAIDNNKTSYSLDDSVLNINEINANILIKYLELKCFNVNTENPYNITITW